MTYATAPSKKRVGDEGAIVVDGQLYHVLQIVVLQDGETVEAGVLRAVDEGAAIACNGRDGCA